MAGKASTRSGRVRQAPRPLPPQTRPGGGRYPTPIAPGIRKTPNIRGGGRGVGIGSAPLFKPNRRRRGSQRGPR